MVDLTSWSERGTQLRARKRKRLLRTRHFKRHFFFLSIDHLLGQTHRDVLYTRRLFGEVNITALDCCDVD